MGKWRDTMKELGGGDISFLSEDGEYIEFVVVGEPAVLAGKFKGVEQVRVGVPAITSDGFTLLIIGKRAARRLSKYEDDFQLAYFRITRHGGRGDTNAVYDVVRIYDEAVYDSLSALVPVSDLPELLAEAITDAGKVLAG